MGVRNPTGVRNQAGLLSGHPAGPCPQPAVIGRKEKTVTEISKADLHAYAKLRDGEATQLRRENRKLREEIWRLRELVAGYEDAAAEAAAEAGREADHAEYRHHLSA